jgi:5-methylcytosine-specific restriction protein A
LTGFGQAKAYFLQYDTKLYDSKAIIGYAHGVSMGARLGPGDFSGGDQTVVRRLQALGFTVLNLRQDWEYDEIVLACELAADNSWRQVYDTDPKAQELSRLL